MRPRLRYDLWRARRLHRAIGRLADDQGRLRMDEQYLRYARAWNVIRAKHPGYLFGAFTNRSMSHRAIRNAGKR